jgi:hypothetical protein
MNIRIGIACVGAGGQEQRKELSGTEPQESVQLVALRGGVTRQRSTTGYEFCAQLIRDAVCGTQLAFAILRS